MYGIGQNQLLVSIPADSGFDSADSADSAGMLTVREATNSDPTLPQEVYPDCPPCDPVIIYRDKVVEKKVLVPGPTQIVYRDRYITSPNSTGLPTSPSGVVETPAPALPFTPPVAADPFVFVPEDSEMYEGGVQTLVSDKKLPWWVYAAGIGGIYFVFKKKKK